MNWQITELMVLQKVMRKQQTGNGAIRRQIPPSNQNGK